MTFAPGTRLGRYEVLSALGAGGMGEVVRATDTKLGRDVALKSLPPSFTSDLERVARFRREAQLLASLNHPSIAQLYGLEEANGIEFLVMELVDGESLDRRIARGPVAIDEAIRISKEVAAALQAAHEKGIVHRDLKPANIALTSEGVVKVLDFGLAKAVESPGGSFELANSPTITSPAMMTQLGVILGTAAYMSPEQAKGRPADKRSDVWAFGCVLYEMLTGRRTFGGDDVSDSLASVLMKQPDWTALPPAVPQHVRRLLRRCLQKDPRLRLESMHDAWLELEEPVRADDENGSERVTKRRARDGFAWAAAAMLALVAILGGLAWRSWTLRAQPPPPETRLDLVTPPTTDPLSLALSPDGGKIVFVAMSGEKPMLWLRRLADEASARPIRGTEYASMPFWAPDSRSVGYFANSRIEAVDIDSGAIQRITSFAIVPGGAAWNVNGIVLFPRVPDSSLFRGSVTGGDVTSVPNLEPQGKGQRDPVFLPDGRHFLFYVAGDPPLRNIYLGDLDGTGSHRLGDADSAAAYTSTGHLLFVRQGTLFAQRLDTDRWQLSGRATPVADRIAFGGATSVAALSASAAGPIAYRTGSTGGKRQLVWVDRSGRTVSSVTEPASHGPAYMSVSPDWQRVAVNRSIDGNVDIWLLSLQGTGGAFRLTSDPRPEIAPVWSPNGDRIVFSRLGQNGFDLFQMWVDSGKEELLVKSDQSKQATDWSRDGRYLLYRELSATWAFDIWARPFDGDRKPFRVVHTNFDARDAQFSPDEKWVAYQADDSGRYEVYVQPFPGPGAPIPISAGGGVQVRWRDDGKELFYIAADGELMAVPFDAGHAGPPARLFLTHVGAFQDVSLPHYVPSRDGKRFLMDAVVEENSAPITVILNWNPQLERGAR